MSNSQRNTILNREKRHNLLNTNSEWTQGKPLPLGRHKKKDRNAETRSPTTSARLLDHPS